MDFTLPPELIELRDRTRRFIAEEIIPMEGDRRQCARGPSEGHRWSMARQLVAAASAHPC